MSTFDVICCENRANGHEDCVGQVTAETKEQAQMEAEGRFECDELHHLFVIEVSEDAE